MAIGEREREGSRRSGRGRKGKERVRGMGQVHVVLGAIW